MRKTKANKKKGVRSWLFRFTLWIGFVSIFVAVLCGGAYTLYLTDFVENRFSGRRWRVPSTVYSDTTVLYPGRGMIKDSFIEKLRRLGYKKGENKRLVRGEWKNSSSGIEVFLHDLVVPWKKRKGFPVKIGIRNGRIAGITHLETGTALPVIELEPEEVMQLFGKERERRHLISINTVPEHLIHAVLAAEDGRFFSHFGFDPVGLARAFYTNFRHGEIRQGGSTLTQQLAKNYFLTHDRTLKRKINELFISIAMEMKYTKREILEIYLNEIYMGQKGAVSVNGMGAAADFYFDKKIEELTLAESAVLAGMIKGPNIYTPYKNREKCRKRRDQVLGTMLKKEWISEKAHKKAADIPVRPAAYLSYRKKAPYFMDYVVSQLNELYPSTELSSLGYAIYTTLDTGVQAAAEKALRQGLERLEKQNGALYQRRPEKKLQGAVVVMQPRTGNILAMVGGRDYSVSQFNRAVQARRQPGSCFKPFVAAAALETFKPSDLFSNQKKTYDVNGKAWTPKNFAEIPGDKLSMRDLLKASCNLATVDLAVRAGLSEVVALADKFRFTTPFQEYPSIALGAFEVIPLELATAYCAFAADGIQPYPLSLKNVVDEAGVPLVRKYVDIDSVISPEKAFLVTSMLESVVREGTARSLSELGLTFPVAGKTGTTNNFRDAWFVGYTPDFLALVWVGFDNGESIFSTGGGAALPIWADLVKSMPEYTSGNGFTIPPGVVKKRICKESGELASRRRCPDIYDEYYLEVNCPLSKCHIHRDPGFFRKFFNKGKSLFGNNDQR
jgi:penicillin-binding protein 1B